MFHQVPLTFDEKVKKVSVLTFVTITEGKVRPPGVSRVVGQVLAVEDGPQDDHDGQLVVVQHSPARNASSTGAGWPHSADNSGDRRGRGQWLGKMVVRPPRGTNVDTRRPSKAIDWRREWHMAFTFFAKIIFNFRSESRQSLCFRFLIAIYICDSLS